MEIGRQIKKRRTELKMTQEELSKKLNVARSTISNWESERNYPDIQLIVSISEILEIPLENLLSEDSEVVKKITMDTKMRKRQGRKIKILYVVIAIIILAGLFCLYKTQNFKDVSQSSEIVSLDIQNDKVTIVTDLPFYRSVSGYYAGDASENQDATEISLYSQIDLSMKNKNKLIVPLDKDLFKHTRMIKIVYNGRTLKSFPVNL